MKIIVKVSMISCLVMALFTTMSAETLDSNGSVPFNENEVNVTITNNSNHKEDVNRTQTLFDFEDFSASGFGGVLYTTSGMPGKNLHFTGGRGGAILNDFLVIGGAGYGLVYPYKRNDFVDAAYQGPNDVIRMGYGGVMVGFHMFQKSAINLSFLTVIGGGGISAVENFEDDEDEQSSQSVSEKMENSSQFFVCEPTLMLHLNVTRWMRVGAGLSYRYTRGIDLDEFSDSDFSNISYVFSAEFGWF
ncbi:MAG: hypothetical protein PF637_11405 [Spirochaetes bacterium]|jgi:hypothetical protein|nr:hypothetical protein [Spirochaetota bacterium]